MKRRSRDVEELSKVLYASATGTFRNIESNTVHSASPLVSWRVSLGLGKPSDCSFGQDGEPASVLPRLEILEVAHADNVRALSNSHSTQSARARSFSRGLRLAAYGGHALAPCDLRLATWGS